MRAFTFIAVISLIITPGIARLYAGDTAPIFDVPRVDGVTIDGKGDDWGDRGFRVSVLPDDKGTLKPAADLDASFRLGWDERGLLVLLNVVDDVADEATNNDLWYGDSVELFYAPKRGAADVVQMVISPGVDPKVPELRSNLNDERTTESLKKTKVTATAVRTKTANGYMLEALLPWENFAIKPEAGREVAFQIYVTDSDGGGRFQARWYPTGSGHDSSSMQRLRLSAKPGPEVKVATRAEYELFRRVQIHVAGAQNLVGKSFKVNSGDTVFASGGKLEQKNGRSGADVELPMPISDKRYNALTVTVEGLPPVPCNLPDLQEARAKAFMNEDFDFKPSVFPGPGFPKCDFAQPSYVEDLIGLYTITSTFYDTDYNPVTAAKKPGRYGAVVEIKTKDGRTYRRLRTLFRTEQRLPWGAYVDGGTINFRKEEGIDPAVAQTQQHSINKYLGFLMTDGFSHGGDTPALMAALKETKPGSPDAHVWDDFAARDRQWWVGLKRKLSGADKLYPEPFVCPKTESGKPAPVLHEGTLQEAGMKEGAADKIDAALKDWAANSDEAFATCIARHGVIILHKAYGTRDGKPMTVDTQSWMASITKAMSGASMMMLVDQGLVNLDDPVSKYLPAFQGVVVPKPLTIRHLYTHTNGLQGHWGDEMHDLEDIIAGYYPNMPIGKRHEYNGAGIALGSKILETITGEALPQFYEHHLLGPLDCTHTDVTTSSWDAKSTPMDIAKFAQMLLNGGSYGDKRFMRPETLKQMLPIKLTSLLGPDTSIEWGIGVVWYKEEGLGKGTYGHGSAASATLRIDQEDDMVIVMTRNTAGKNFTEYHKKFLAAVMDNIAK